jgi:hypothetical protein
MKLADICVNSLLRVVQDRMRRRWLALLGMEADRRFRSDSLVERRGFEPPVLFVVLALAKGLEVSARSLR